LVTFKERGGWIKTIQSYRKKSDRQTTTTKQKTERKRRRSVFPIANPLRRGK